MLALKYVFASELAAWCATPLGRFAAPVITCGPLLFASVIFARLFSAATGAANALGWNIIGGLSGGGLELLAIFLGNRALNLVAFVIYSAALALHLVAARSQRMSDPG